MSAKNENETIVDHCKSSTYGGTDTDKGYHKIVHFACERDFSVFRKHAYSTLFKPTHFSRKTLNYTFSTFLSDNVY